MQNLLYFTAICILFAGSVLAADDTVANNTVENMQHQIEAQQKALEQAAKQGYAPAKISSELPETAYQQHRNARTRDLVGVAIDNKPDNTDSTHIVDVYGERKRMEDR